MTIRPISKHRVAATRELLRALFPMAFAERGADKRPLMIGVGTQILLDRPEIGGANLAAALSDYTSGATYLRNCIVGAARVDLFGNECGVVTEPEATHAALRLKAFKAFEKAADATAKKDVA